ncbi:MAG: hypothetical protein ACRDK7_06035 [Solirubrobacteraceae bacterium]
MEQTAIGDFPVYGTEDELLRGQVELKEPIAFRAREMRAPDRVEAFALPFATSAESGPSSIGGPGVGVGGDGGYCPSVVIGGYPGVKLKFGSVLLIGDICGSLG